MNAARFDPPRGGRPLWLTTFADLSLLLVGFFVFLQANAHVDGRALADGFRSAFAADALPPAAPAPMAVERAMLGGFAPASADLPAGAGDVAAWAAAAARDPRVAVRLTGLVDGAADDVDPATGSGDLLAMDRTRAVAALLVTGSHVPAARITIAAPQRGPARGVQLEMGFAGDRQEVARRQNAVAAGNRAGKR